MEADVIYYYLCGPDRQWHLTSMSLRPIQAALSIWECIKTALDPEAFAEARADLSNAPGFVIDIICACMDLDPCACAIMKLAAGTLAGAVQGGWAGAGLGALKNITGLWDCICIEISFGGGGSTSGGGPGPGGGGWWWPSLGGGRGRQAPPGSSTIDPWIDPIEFTMPSSPGCTPGAVKPASSDASPGTSEVAPADEEEEGVCARVRLRLQQDLVMTRSAFLGTLEIENGDEKIGLEGISVTLEFTDADHNPANDLFAVRPPQLRGISAVDGTGTLAAATRGTAEYIIIPTREAAPDVMTMYMVGGTLRYVDRGEEVVLPLFPATIRVYPDPVLELHYFWEREVCSDDPFTPEVEPAVPFSLGLAITNTGKGTARDVRIISGQPQIVENEKGLLIDFKIIATEVGGDSVQPSLTAFFGTIDPSKTAVARWLMTSTLQGRFIEYSATFEHLDAIGDKHISLIDSVAIHELIHVVRVDKPQDDGLFDFLANDVEDDDHLPDCVYLSAGGSLPVTAVTEATVDVQQAEGGIVATVTAAMPEGWAYLRIPDPGQHVYKLTKVSRADGSEVMLDCNAWTTHRVRRPLGGEPYDEDRLHIFDFNSSGSYTLEYETDWAAIDHTPPISSVGPLPDVSTSGQIAVQWSGEDDASGISFFDVFVSVSGGPFVPWRTRTTQTGAIYSGSEKNTYAFYSVATDVAGNREGAPAEPDTLTYVPDMTPPAVTLGLAAASDSGVAGDRITNIVTPALAGSTEPQATVAVAITGPADYSAGGTTEADEAGRWSFAIPAGQPMAADGSYHVTASAVDTAGNASLIDATLDITIDRTPPTSTATAPSGNVPLRFRVEWSGQDGGSGVSSYDVYAAADGGSFSLWKAQTGAASAYYGGVLDHTYEFYSVARDAAGNLEQKVPAGEAAGTVIKALPVPGDANADCSVNVLDLIFIRNHLGADAASGSNWQADMNGDTRINVLDLIYVRNRLGTACP